jgi:hypothetical protein
MWSCFWGPVYDPVGVAIVAAKAGKDLGPVLMACAPATGPLAPWVATAGGAYTAIGWGTWAITDVIGPMSALAVDQDLGPAVESIVTNWTVPSTLQIAGGAAASASPYVGPAYDTLKLLSGACWGTGCPR